MLSDHNPLPEERRPEAQMKIEDLGSSINCHASANTIFFHVPANEG